MIMHYIICILYIHIIYIHICIWYVGTSDMLVQRHRVLPREHTGHRKCPLNTREDSTHGHHQMANTKIRLIIFFVAKDGEVLCSQQKQDWKLTVAHFRSWTPYAKFRLILKKVGKTTRPFRCDLNQIPYGYRMEETNRFNYQIRSNRVPEELWTEVCDIIQQWSKPSPRKRNAKGQNGCLRRPYK